MQNAVRSRAPLSRRCAPGIRWQVLIERRGNRRLSSYLSREEDVESLKVVCGSAGSIDVDLYNTSALTNPTAPLVLYLPPTGTHLRSSHFPSYLFHPSAALARINYRWNIPLSTPSSPSTPQTPPPTPKLLSSHPAFTSHPFPTPLHDTLHAYTYILHSFLPRFSPSPPSTTTPHSPHSFPKQTPKIIQRPILVYGTYLGGTLATSLALTESFASKNLPTRIAGLISRNGIYDWTDIATSPPSPHSSEASQGARDPSQQEQGETWDAANLHLLKHLLFTSPASAFDPFASPALFFRTSGLPIPKTWPADDPPTPTPSPPSTPPPTSSLPTTLTNDGEDIFHQTPNPSLPTDADPALAKGTRSRGTRGGDLEPEVTRSANLKYPPKDSGLKIPRSLFLYTKTNSQLSENGIRDDGGGEGGGEITPRGQAEEMVRVMRRSILLHEFKDRVLWDENLDPEAAASSRVQLSSLRSSLHEDEGRIVREWINDTLDT